MTLTEAILVQWHRLPGEVAQARAGGSTGTTEHAYRGGSALSRVNIGSKLVAELRGTGSAEDAIREARAEVFGAKLREVG